MIGRRKRPHLVQAQPTPGSAPTPTRSRNGQAPARGARHQAPRPPDGALRRPRLVDFLHETVNRKLILIAAAAGYGKSSLLAEFAAETDYPVAWLQLTEADRDLSGLISDLAFALQARFPHWSSDLPRLAAQAGASAKDLALVLAREIETGLDDYFVLVCDDFHLVEREPAVIDFFNELLAQLPPQAHLIVSGRALPPLRYAVLAARGQVAGLSEEQLRFTPDEAQALLKLSNQVDLPAGAAETLVAHTEGWITGILLTTHLLWQGLMANLIGAQRGERPLYEYLAAEVLDQQPPALQQFLMESAVLPEMAADECDAVLGRTDSAELLQRAEARRLFVSAVGEEAPAYQYHHLFRDFLQARLRQRDPERLRALQSRAAAWYREHDMPEAAVTFHVMAGELSAAARLAEVEAKNLYTAGRHATLRRWAEQLTPVAMEIPRLHLYLAIGYLDVREFAPAQAELDQAEGGYRQRQDAGGLLGVELRRCSALVFQGCYAQALPLAEAIVAQAPVVAQGASQALALRYLGICQQYLSRPAEAEAALTAARDLLRDSPSRYDLALTLHDLAGVYRQRGKTTAATQAQHEALAILRAEGAAMPLAGLLNNIGWDLHMLGQYEAALATYAEALQWAQRAGTSHVEREIREGQASLLADLGAAAQAVSLYQQILGQAQDAGEEDILMYVACGLARLDRRAGNYAGALEWLRRAEAYQNGRQLNLAMTNVAGLRAIIKVEMGRPAEGLAALRRVRSEFEAREAPLDLTQTLFYEACAAFRAGDNIGAAAALGRAFEVAERIGYDQMLLREAPFARDVLGALRSDALLGTRVTGLLDRADMLDAVRARLIKRGLMTASPEPVTETPAALDIRAFGGARVCKDGVEIPRGAWGAQRARDLFFFLVDHMPVPRDQVLVTFWPNLPQARAVANLYQTLYRLRRAIGSEVVELAEQTCRAAPGPEARSDARQFEAQATAALNTPPSDMRRLGALAAADALCTGDYLPEVDTDWANSRRQKLQALHVQILAEYADELLRYTRYSEARQVLERVLEHEPLRDDLHGRMLICLAALGRRHEVVDHYRRYREGLRSELGLDPPAEIRQLYARLIE
ncbi:MAG: tetratricopeptide repeat protein [Anaerolineales bacterium]|nr:tetratricopeptide repeat protein [Anaerolineales bacterium]